MMGKRLCSCRNTDGVRPKVDPVRCSRVLSNGYDVVYRCKLEPLVRQPG
jgi:hypothetical protein